MAGFDTGVVLSARQCLEIGHHAMDKDRFYQAINWMETGLIKIRAENDSSASLEVAKELLETAKKVV